MTHINAGKVVKKLSKWIDLLKDVPVFLIGNGPSLEDIDLSPIADFFTIGINRPFPKIDPTVLIWQDLALWTQEKSKVKKLQALKFVRFGGGGDFDNKDYIFFHLKGKDSSISGDPSILMGRGSSGPLSFQLAYMLGCNPIVLLGMDCKYKELKPGKYQTDYYGINPMHRSHTLPNCRRGLKFMKNHSKHRIIYNCSPNHVFDKNYSLEKVLSKIDYKPEGREFYKEKLLQNAK